nr:MAG TPA: hypothetical protein [Caudoviricetes sp.]
MRSRKRTKEYSLTLTREIFKKFPLFFCFLFDILCSFY